MERTGHGKQSLVRMIALDRFERSGVTAEEVYRAKYGLRVLIVGVVE
jgi:hypothetical protein